MFQLPEFLDPDYYIQGGETSWVVVESVILAFFLSTWTALACYRFSLKKHSVNLFWLGNFSLAYAIWNLLYLSAYSKKNIEIPSATVTVEFANQAHLFVGIVLPYLCNRFLSTFFSVRNFVKRLPFYSLLALAALLFFLQINYYYALLLTGVFIFGSFSLILWTLWRFYITTEDLKMKTRSYFIFMGLLVCTAFSAIGQARAENLFRMLPLPYVGNILTTVFVYFVYQMALNPRLREIRELMLRGIRVLILAIVLTAIFISLLSWVKESNLELFVFNTFMASFIILSILEPLRRRMDSFFLKRFIVDRYEFEELLKKLPKKLRKARNLDELSMGLIEGVRESGRIYQAAFFLWDPGSADYRLIPPSNLTFKSSLPTDHPFVSYSKTFKLPLLLEQDQELPVETAEALREMHSHIVLPLFRQDDLLGLWALRSSLKSTNPYTSFSNDEIELLEQISQDLIGVLEQIQHFESQERQGKLATLGEMSAALAHEIRNPLGAIQGATELLQTSPTLKNDEDRECVQILTKEISKMQKTVDQYLNFARKNEEPVLVSVATLTQGIILDVESKAKKTQSKIHFETAEQIPEIKTDPLKLEQVLFNIIQNACEAFSKNVWVSVGVEKRETETPIKIVVRDDGPGISPQHLHNIFTPLFTTKKAGSGLGLPICKKIVDSLGGDLQVESGLGKGTVFTILLPREPLRMGGTA